MAERPVFSRFYEWLSRLEDRAIAGYRKEVVADAPGRVLEVGVGNGLNLERYRMADLVVALDPERRMLRRAVPRARRARVPVRLVRGSAEELPFPGGAFDVVVASLVLCSIPDPAVGASEIRRVLAPGGEVRFFEHVRSAEPSVARWQDRLNGVYGRFSGGCNMNRDTVLTLRRAGFRVRFRRLPYGPRMAPHVIGVARED